MRDFMVLRVAVFFVLVASVPAAGREVISLDRGWRFHRGDFAESQLPTAAEYDDQGWALVDVPHDYVIEETYRNGDRDWLMHGALPLDVGWYRRTIEFPASAEGKWPPAACFLGGAAILAWQLARMAGDVASAGQER